MLRYNKIFLTLWIPLKEGIGCESMPKDRVTLTLLCEQCFLYINCLCVCVCYDCYIQTSEWSQVGLWTLFSLFKEDLCDAFHFSGLEFFLILHAHFCIFSFLGKEEPPLLACLFCSTQHKWDPSGYFFLPLVLGFGYL